LSMDRKETTTWGETIETVVTFKRVQIEFYDTVNYHLPENGL